jgi:ankyrin repeat protein
MKKEKTELHYAVQQYNKSKLELLLTQMTQEEINQVDENGDTALSVATIKGYKDAVELLLKHENIKINQVDENGEIALHWAARLGYKDVVELLLKHEDIDVNLANNYGWTALHLSILKNDKDIVELPLDHAHVNALKLLLKHENIDVVELLLKHENIDINLADKYGFTALHFGVLEGAMDIVELLLQNNNIDVNLTDQNLKTALHLAAEIVDTDIVKLLLDTMTPEAINKIDKDGKTAFNIAAISHHDNILNLFIESGKCDLNAKDHEGNDIWAYYAPDQENSIEITGLVMEHDKKYPDSAEDLE